MALRTPPPAVFEHDVVVPDGLDLEAELARIKKEQAAVAPPPVDEDEPSVTPAAETPAPAVEKPAEEKPVEKKAVDGAVAEAIKERKRRQEAERQAEEDRQIRFAVEAENRRLKVQALAAQKAEPKRIKEVVWSDSELEEIRREALKEGIDPKVVDIITRATTKKLNEARREDAAVDQKDETARVIRVENEFEKTHPDYREVLAAEIIPRLLIDPTTGLSKEPGVAQEINAAQTAEDRVQVAYNLGKVFKRKREADALKNEPEPSLASTPNGAGTDGGKPAESAAPTGSDKSAATPSGERTPRGAEPPADKAEERGRGIGRIPGAPAPEKHQRYTREFLDQFINPQGYDTLLKLYEANPGLELYHMSNP